MSNNDLLEIISQTKEPTAVQIYLKKLFENIKAVEFDNFKNILAMLSGDGEKVRFVNPIDPNEKYVEEWL